MTTNVSKNRRILKNGLWYGGFWLLFALWLRLCVPESIMGWERHQLFRYAADYLSSFFNTTAYPFLYYVQAFFTQFYVYPLSGAAVIGALLVLGMGAWHRLTGQRWPGAVWAALMLPLIPYFNLLWLLTWLILLLGALCISRLVAWRGWLRYGLLVVLGLLVALLMVENAVWVVVFWAVVYGCVVRSWRGSLCALGFLGLGAALGIGLLLWKGYPYYYAPYFSHFILLKAHYRADSFPAIFFKCPLFIKMVSYVTLGVGLLLSCVTLLSPISKGNDKTTQGSADISDEQDNSVENDAVQASTKANRKRCLIQGGTGVMIAALFVYAGYLNLRYQMEDFYLVYRLNAEQRYFEASAVAETALFEREQTEQANRRLRHFSHRRPQQVTTLAAKLGVKPVGFQHKWEREYLADALRVALLGDKQATERLFFYSGLGYFPLLFTENIFLKPAQHFVALYYTQNGLYAEALHLLYDLITTGHITKTVVESVLWNSVVVKDYAPCRKFIRLFEQTLFHQDIARRYAAYLADTAATDRQPEIAAARLRLSNYDYSVLAYNPDDNIHFRLRYDAHQPPIYEYALSLWMIYKNHPKILAELPKIRQYYPRLPRHIQEAVLANFPPERIDEVPEEIDPEIKGLYVYFMQSYELYMNGYASLQLLEKNFEDTYWFHLYFNQKQSVKTADSDDDSNDRSIITRPGSEHQI